MKKVKTNDGSYTLYNESYKEHYHSLSGAWEEAFKKYVEPCDVRSGYRILDICFGLGYNSLAAMMHAGKISIVALEKDKAVLEALQKLQVPDGLKASFAKIKKAAKDLKYKDEQVQIDVLLGDARKTIKQVSGLFDAVFLDPFSVPKNPELWTVDFLREIKRVMKPQAVLATYSSAAPVRQALVEAGFQVGNGPIVGRVRPATLASVAAELPSLSEEDVRLMRAFGTPFRDQNLNSSKQEIQKLREKERLGL